MNDELIQLLADLVEFWSITPKDDGCIEFIAHYLEEVGFVNTIIRQDETTNLIASFSSATLKSNSAATDESDAKKSAIQPITVAFAGHIDVVPPGDSSQWQYAPFHLTAADGKLYGRGVSDMKGAVAGFLYAIKQFIEEIKQCVSAAKNMQHLQPFVLLVLITSDEEGDALNGTSLIVKYLQEQNITIDYCILGEPSASKTVGDVIKVGRRGSLNGMIEVIGKQGHVAYPQLCSNPMHTFAPIMLRLIRHQFDEGTHMFPPTNLQFTNINCGIGANNVIPQTLRAKFNVRYNDNYTEETLIKTIRGIIASTQNSLDTDYGISMTGVQINSSFITNGAKPFATQLGALAQAISTVISEFTGLNAVLSTDGGTSDGRFLIAVSKELVEFGLSNQTAHQIDEHIQEADLRQLTKMYYALLIKLLFAAH